jgi:phosphomannomutase
MEFRDATHPENDWWFSLRLSNTEPLIRLNLESRSKELTDQKVAELTAIVTV